MWYIPAAVRDADSVSIGDGEFHTNSTKASDVSFDALNNEDSIDRAPSSRSSTPARLSKPRGKNDNFESAFHNVATSLVALVEKQAEKNASDISPAKQNENKLKYAQMYEELDRALENATFLSAVKFLTNTIEAAASQFPPKSE